MNKILWWCWFVDGNFKNSDVFSFHFFFSQMKSVVMQNVITVPILHNYLRGGREGERERGREREGEKTDDVILGQNSSFIFPKLIKKK